MPYILNALPTPVNTQAQGTWLAWKAGEIKTIHNENKAAFFEEKRAEEGLVRIPEEIMELEKTDPARIAFIQEKTLQGISKRIQYLDTVIRNQEVFLKQDFERHNMKVDPLSIADKKLVAVYKERAALAAYEKKNTFSAADEIRKIKAEMEGPVVENGNIADSKPGTNSEGRSSTAKPAASGKQ